MFARRVVLSFAFAIALALPALASARFLPAPLAADEPHTEEGGLDFSQAFWPTQSHGNKGTDVKVIQLLLKQRGYDVTVDGTWGGAAMTDAVKAFQRSQGLTADGIVGPTTWAKLAPQVSEGASGEKVKAIQILLNQKRFENVPVDGTWNGNVMTDAVKRFQRHAGIADDGIVGDTTWKNLVWHYERLGNVAGVCGVDVESEEWGTAAAIGQFQSAGEAFVAKYDKGKAAVNDFSLEHGGSLDPHVSHQKGLDADVRLVRDDNTQCSNGCTYTSACYDRDGTRKLIDEIMDAAPGHVKLILFNDPQLEGYRGVVQYYSGHDDHMHVRWCEKVHPDSTYAC